ncbi:hypothetical protein HEQ62_10830 [Haematospirillum jordaniae]|uniref:hypothetical protein n=1 Tax=Haematospirillum jordaniae TaxID=1549855 RepID=UPI0014331393|nr:hypothetical protein [Haematospirillum jordaniae]NKD46281.1 hypothetical protein [Haematospirillum jordaniae]NKD58147.1 hypothetical protein [Haematospirillum jordaniae]NKD60256.1 hypothetical protein [Haematospirillum jordaniae]NKD68187.1 hypothetical protein [Haematospirillum jordaniae]NKD80220.1 hypothetical protein [Haematospirillum jordaniae]
MSTSSLTNHLTGFRLTPPFGLPDGPKWQCRRGAFEKHLVKFGKPPPRKTVLRWKEQLAASPEVQRYEGRGRSVLAVYRACLETINWHTGELAVSYKTLGEKAGYGRTTVYKALKFLREHGIIFVVNRCVKRTFDNGRFLLKQVSNAYAFLSSAQWNLKMDDSKVFARYPFEWPSAREMYKAAREVGEVREGLALLERYGNASERKHADLDRRILDQKEARKRKPPD